MKRIPSLSEARMQEEEALIPVLAAQAGQAAHDRALRLNGRVCTVRDGAVVEAWADGSVRLIKPLPPPTPATPGTVLKRRSA